MLAAGKRGTYVRAPLLRWRRHAEGSRNPEAEEGGGALGSFIRARHRELSDRMNDWRGRLFYALDLAAAAIDLVVGFSRFPRALRVVERPPGAGSALACTGTGHIVTDQRSILLLCRTARREAANVAEHINALTRLSRHKVHPFNPVDRPDAAALARPRRVRRRRHPLHDRRHLRLLPPLRAAPSEIERFDGLKVQFIQDEYRWVDEITARMRELGIDVLFTCVPENAVPAIYGDRLPGVETITTLAGFVPDRARRSPRAAAGERPIDVGYRGRAVPFWLGRLGQDKIEIGEDFLARAARDGPALRHRVDGERPHLRRALDPLPRLLPRHAGHRERSLDRHFDGSIEAPVHDYLAEPRRDLRGGRARAPARHEGNVVINVISPRVFEAAALRTALVLFPGRYSGAVAPWTHYLPLEQTSRTSTRSSERLRDLSFLEELTGRAHADLVESGEYSLRRFVREFDDEIERLSTARSAATKRSYRNARRRGLQLAPCYVLRFLAGKQPRRWRRLWSSSRDAAVRRLAGVAGKTQALREDLWRLAALRRGVRMAFSRQSPTLEDDGRRLLVTTRAPTVPATESRR